MFRRAVIASKKAWMRPKGDPQCLLKGIKHGGGLTGEEKTQHRGLAGFLDRGEMGSA